MKEEEKKPPLKEADKPQKEELGNNPRWDDIVFEKRNKEYGAYFIRLKYVRHLVTGVIITLLFVGVVLAVPTVVRLLTPPKPEEDVVMGTTRYNDLAQPPPIDKEMAPPPKMDVPPPVRTILKFLPPEVTSKPETQPDSIPSMENLNQHQTGTENVKGDDSNPYDNLPTDLGPPGDGDGAPNDDQIFTVVEQAPEFEGGMEALVKFLRKNLHYPAKAQRMGIEGSVYVSFIVDKEGNINEVQVLKGIDPDCDKEAVRVVQKMPSWKAGKQNGKPVKVRFVLPIKFKLNT